MYVGHDNVSIVLKSKITWWHLDYSIFFDCNDHISSEYPDDYIIGDLVFEKENDTIYGMRFIFIDDCLGMMKRGKHPDGNWRVLTFGLKDDWRH